MDDNQMNRIEAFLASIGLDTGSVPKQRITQLRKIDTAVQKRLSALSEAQRMLKENAISIVAIAEDSGITRKTFYNNEILKQYVKSFSSVDGEPGKMVKASEIESMKKRIEEQADDIAKMVSRDIDIETIRHEADELKKIIDSKDKQIQNLTEMYETTLAELQQERASHRKVKVVDISNKRSSRSS